MRLPDQPDVLLMGHPILFREHHQVCLDDLKTEDFLHNLDVLKEQQVRSQGIGLAAPQIGWEARVMSLGISEINRFRYPKAPDIPFCFWINPQVVEFSKETCWTWEACLSVPGLRGWVERPRTIKVSGYDENGLRKEVEMTDFPARVMQHELDHLNGILFPMRVDDKSLIIPNQSIEHQEEWAENWPTPNARNTLRGQISPDR